IARDRARRPLGGLGADGSRADAPERSGEPRLRDLHVGFDRPAEGSDEFPSRDLEPLALDAGGLSARCRGHGGAKNTGELRRLGLGVLLALDDGCAARARETWWVPGRGLSGTVSRRGAGNDDALRPIDAPSVSR